MRLVIRRAQSDIFLWLECAANAIQFEWEFPKGPFPHLIPLLNRATALA